VTVMTSSSQPPDLDRYLARHRFRPHAGHGTWLDRDTGQHVLRVVREPGEPATLICLAPSGACLYQAAFTLGTPPAVITATIDAALTLSQPEPAARSRPWHPGSGRRNPAARYRGRNERQ